jgi:FtsH-binding integral membrane protein
MSRVDININKEMNLSNISSGKISYEERQKNLGFLRTLYSLFALELLIAVVWTSFALSYYPEFGDGIKRWWEFAIVSGVLCLLLILISFIFQFARNFPINVAIYLLFTFSFMHFTSWLCLVDPTYLVYYALWLLLFIALGFAVYAWSTNSYMNTMISILVIVASTLIVFIAFLIFSEVIFLGLLLVLLGAIIYGFYLNYDVRKMVRGGASEYSREDAWTGAVRIWAEGLLVFTRFIELLGRSCCK